MQISDMGMAFLMQGFAFILAIVSIVLADYLTKKTGQIASRSVRAVLWASFVIITSVLLISSNALMIGSVHHPEITSSIVTCILLGFCGFISLSKDSVSQNPIHPE